MAHSSIATGFPLTCKLCPINLLPDDSHDICCRVWVFNILREAQTRVCTAVFYLCLPGGS